MGKPVERQNYSLPFFILASLIFACTLWVFHEELVGRRPWKEHQERIFTYEREQALLGIRYHERRLEAGDLKVTPDPTRPEETLTVDEARKRLAALAADERTRLQAAIDAALAPLTSARAELQSVLERRTGLTQYWLTSYDSSVDRCQNCHASVDRCGFARPHEVVTALGAPDAKPEQVAGAFCVTPDVATHYGNAAGEICSIRFDEAASAAGTLEGGRCFAGEERERLAELFINYCGRGASALEVLGSRRLAKACVGAEGWTALAGYVEDPEESGACGLELGAEGEVCAEGERRDHLLVWLSRHCNEETSSTIRGLRRHAKACASGEAGKKLGALEPVLYEYPVWAQTHPHRADLLTGHHPPERFGCTTCHEGQGPQTKGVAGKPFEHGYDDPYWERPMLDLVAHKQHRPQSWGPPAANTGVPGEWVSHERQYVQSSCAKCHREEVRLEYADTYGRGRRLAAELGCHGCHPMSPFQDLPKLGPTLIDLRQKTTPSFLLDWIAYPAAFRPRTKMPNFWPEALDVSHRLREGSPEAARREREVRQIVAYLWKSSDEARLPEPPVKGDVERGRLLVRKVGCRACHNFVPPEQLCTPEQIVVGKSRGTPESPGECEVARGLTGSAARDFAPNLSNIGLKTNARWLFAWLKAPSERWARARMPNLRLSDQEAADLTAYLLTLRAGPAPGGAGFFEEGSSELEQAAAEGSKLIGKYGCAGCHDIRGHEGDSKIGADLNDYGRKSVDLMDFGNAIPNPRHHGWYNFVDLKLRAPRAYGYERVEALMPQFDLDDDEVDALMVFLKSQTGDQVPAAYQVWRDERRTAVARGEQLMERYNCKGCHMIDGDGGRLQDMYSEDLAYMAPPVLQKEGWRVQPEWLFGFLRDPSETLRPWLDVRMPTFPMGDEQATGLVRAFAASAGVSYPYLSVEAPRMSEADHAEVRKMVDGMLNCFKCHTTGEPAPEQDRASLAPDLRRAKRRLRPDWVLEWMRNPQALQEGTRMPTYFSPEDPSAEMYPDYFGGSQEKQIAALRDFVMALPDEPGKSKAGSGAVPARRGR